MVSNRVARIIGKVENTERFLRVALFQGNVAKRAGAIARMPGGADTKQAEGDPTLVAAAYQRQRFYLFTRREPQDTEEAAQGRCVPSSLSGRVHKTKKKRGRSVTGDGMGHNCG